MSEISREDLIRAENYFKGYITPESGLVMVDCSSGTLRLGFTSLEKLRIFSVNSVTIGDVIITPSKHLITIGEEDVTNSR